MKKLMKFIVPAAMLLLQTNCMKIEYKDTAYYTFINKSSNAIELKICSTNETDVTTHTIAVGDQLTLFDGGVGGFPQFPLALLCKKGPLNSSYLVISNGTTEIIQYLDNGTGLYTGLYDLGNYKRVRYEPSKKSSSIWYEYEFTDAFFEQDTTE